MVWCVTAATLVLGACSPTDSDTDVSLTSTTTTTPPIASTTAPSTSSTTLPAVDAPIPFDSREAGDVFAFVDEWEVATAAGWASPMLSPFALPADAGAASPDGRGGVVFIMNDQVWWMSNPTAEPVVIEQPGIPVQLIGLRHVDGEPVVLVRIGDKLIGYDRGDGELAHLLDRFTGDIVRIDVDRNHVVAIVEARFGWSVELMYLSTGEVRELIAPIEADRDEAPVQVAISGDRVVVVGRSSPAKVVSTTGAPVTELDFGLESIPIMSADLVGQSLLIAFGEAAIVANIATGERYVADTLEGWVTSAIWVASPAIDEPDISNAMRFRVNTELVESDVADPFLNVRWGPGAENELTAKLPPTYTGLLRTGPEETSADGAVWFQVELLDPIHATPPEPLEGRAPIGWVNSAYLEPLPEGLPVTLEELPGCVDADPASVASGAVPEHVYALESAMLSDRCLRVVLTFGSGEMPGWWGDQAGRDLGPAASLPDVFHAMSGSRGSYIDLGGVTSAWPWLSAADDEVYVVRNGSGLQLWMLQPVRWEAIHALPERGIVVVDYTLDSALQDTDPPDERVVLTGGVWDTADGVIANGITRPYEGNLGVSIRDSSGEPVEAVFSGSLALGTIRADHYSVQTNDWTEAWAPFALQVEGLDPGEYQLRLNPGGSSPTLAVPFTVETWNSSGNPDWMEQFVGPPPLVTEQELDIVQALVAFARGEGDLASVPLADEVTLGLNTVDFRVRTRSQLRDRDAWVAGVDQFDGFSGTFSPLSVLATSGFVRVTAGPIPHCAGPPLEWPSELDGLRQINVEPIGVDSCIQWFGVSLLLNDQGEVEAIVLDLFGP